MTPNGLHNLDQYIKKLARAHHEAVDGWFKHFGMLQITISYWTPGPLNLWDLQIGSNGVCSNVQKSVPSTVTLQILPLSSMNWLSPSIYTSRHERNSHEIQYHNNSLQQTSSQKITKLTRSSSFIRWIPAQTHLCMVSSWQSQRFDTTLSLIYILRKERVQRRCIGWKPCGNPWSSRRPHNSPTTSYGTTKCDANLLSQICLNWINFCMIICARTSTASGRNLMANKPCQADKESKSKLPWKRDGKVVKQMHRDASEEKMCPKCASQHFQVLAFSWICLYRTCLSHIFWDHKWIWYCRTFSSRFPRKCQKVKSKGTRSALFCLTKKSKKANIWAYILLLEHEIRQQAFITT